MLQWPCSRIPLTFDLTVHTDCVRPGIKVVTVKGAVLSARRHWVTVADAHAETGAIYTRGRGGHRNAHAHNNHIGGNK